MLVHILTGPPGSGKTTYAAKNFLNLPVYDKDLGNKDRWKSCKQDCVLMTSAPSSNQKEYWLSRIEKQGKESKLYTIWVDRMVAYERMKLRSGLTPGQKNNIEKSVERWYKMYSRHPKEKRVASV